MGPADHDRRPSTARQDEEAWQEICEVFGDSEALARLDTFRTELRENLASISDGSLDLEAVQHVAHRTVARAGFLGFRDLTEASVALDEAARAGTDVAMPLERWIKEAGRVVASTRT